MRKVLYNVLLVIFGHAAFSQAVTVPSVIQFADMELRLNDRAREEIQNDVNALTRSEKYFNIKLDRILQYFPLIERTLREQNVPEDFKYLVIQESALIPDAVSSSNAVGFWQFKESSGEEVGLRIDRYIDERMNIISATRGASRYLKTNNFYYDNWIYALIAYNTGRGGAESYVDNRYFGSKKMEINKHTHWYVKKYLAHKIAFQNSLGRDRAPSRYLYEYTKGGGRSLSEIAAELNLNPDELQEYNKWVRRGTIPDDKVYTVIIPSINPPEGMIAGTQKEIQKPENTVTETELPVLVRGKYPIIESLDEKETRLLSINGIPGTLARKGDKIESLADLGQILLKDFLKFNDIDITHRVLPGQVYYFKRKRNKASEHYHIVYPGEDSWTIAQKYGIKEKKLLRKNRIRKDHSDFEKGRVVWLRFIRPGDYPVEYAEIPALAVSGQAQSAGVYSDPSMNVQDAGINGNETEQAQWDNEPADYIETHLNPDEKVSANGIVPENSSVNKGPAKEKTDLFNDDSFSSSPLFHVVESGETLYGISKAYGISVENLRNINDLGVNDNLQIGQKVYLKNPFPEESTPDFSKVNDLNEPNPYIIYQVKRGETLYAISRKFDVTVDEIRDWNHKNDYSINEGDFLKIKR
ncbi:MAG: LysM peptidoglycan-binding domain-containing protein [Cyclobacteriaceae bacterium]|nr:LysM peptidoglycan-binding domain-containing protein [Cyclobacteriaceae bacterium]